MNIGDIDINVNENNWLVISKSKKQKYQQLFYYLLMFLLIVVGFAYLISNRTDSANFGFAGIFLLIIFLIAMISIIYFDIKRAIKNNTDYALHVDNSKIYINEIYFCR